MSSAAIDQLTPTRLSQAAKVSMPYASQMIAGRRVPALKVAAKIEEALGIPAVSWVAHAAACEAARAAKKAA